MSAVAWPGTGPGRSKHSVEVGKKKVRAQAVLCTSESQGQLFSLYQVQIKFCLPQEPPLTNPAPRCWEV